MTSRRSRRASARALTPSTVGWAAVAALLASPGTALAQVSVGTNLGACLGNLTACAGTGVSVGVGGVGVTAGTGTGVSVGTGSGSGVGIGTGAGITVGTGGAGTTVGTVVNGLAGAVQPIANLPAGTAATNAATVGQVVSVGSRLAASLGGGAALDLATGVYLNPGYLIRGTLHGDVGSALADIDLRLGTLGGGGGGGGPTVVVNNPGGGTTIVGGVTLNQDLSSRAISLGGNTDGRVLNVGGTEGDRRVTGVATGIAANDAVNVSQLSAAMAEVPLRGTNTAGRPAPVAAGADALAVGYGARAEAANSVAIGNGAVATRANQVAVGTARSTYTLAGIASAESAAAQSGPTRFVTTDAAGNLATSPYGPGSIAALDGRVSDVEAKMAGVARYATEGRREARQGIASAMSMTAASMPSAPGRTSWAMNTATFRGEWAAGGALAHRLDTAVPLAVTAGYAYGGGNSHGVRVGLGGEF